MSQGIAPRMRLGHGIARRPLAAACIAALLMAGTAAAQDTQAPLARQPLEDPPQVRLER